MRHVWAFLMTMLFGSTLLGQSPVVPFHVAKIAPSGPYSASEFQVVWSAFRKQYRMEASGAFVQYRFAEMFFASAESGRRNVTDLNPVLLLFANTAAAGIDAAHMTGAQRSQAPKSAYKSADEATKVILKWGCPPVTLDVQMDTSTPGKPAYKATSVGEGAPVTMPFFPSYAAGRFQLGQQIMQAERGKADGANAWVQVRELPDDKLCRDNFMAALKAGAAFRVYTLRDVTCQNCGGLGTIAANGGTTEAMKKPARGSNSLDQKCAFCGGDGKVPVGRLHVLVWEKMTPGGVK